MVDRQSSDDDVAKKQALGRGKGSSRRNGHSPSHMKGNWLVGEGTRDVGTEEGRRGT